MNKEIYRGSLVFFALLIASVIGLGAKGLLIGHIDFTTYYSTETNEWISEFRHGEFDNPDARTPTDEVSLPARDFLGYEVNGHYLIPTFEGDRFIQSSLSKFDFRGAADGDPIWTFTHKDNLYSWPGFRNDQVHGTFREYTPNDNTTSISVNIRLV